MTRTIQRLASLVLLSTIGGAVALCLHTLPGLRRLPKAKEQSINGITTIDDAVRYLRTTGKTGWELVAATQLH